MTIADVVGVEQRGAVAHVTFNRPDALNALDMALASTLDQTLARLAVDETVGAIVLTGAGRAFMAGGDVREFAQTLDGPAAARSTYFSRLIDHAHGAVERVWRMPKPVIAAINGPVAGFGIGLAAACDFSIAVENAGFSLAYCHLGATPDGGATLMLPHLCGLKQASALVMLGDRFGAAEAHRLGIVNQVVAADALANTVDALSQRLADGPLGTHAATKALLRGPLTAAFLAQLQAEKDQFTARANGAEFAEGLRAFLGKRKPDFTSRPDLTSQDSRFILTNES
ncbi:enoyl-CoA hydratase [Niveispirillum sp. SYP-B3756]|uniref:enoyl-CoA hydratase/isomerase family protein n=1 Tax=Niveispirillum sp. SYP-B3756 TaxID=2662178 RepID=UPI001292ABB1|nr:enoyl-CoA hydratase-related protein [Niveispirillum sp. SYP-B3756]MQP64965.1 enoyl-CoA hydratase [Niveispirillum sp. SYP-B3756]